jgi:all-trans-retinol 13,14-reductase
MDLSYSYKQRPAIDDHYDAICIGSGLGSLVTANILAKKGKKVLVLEKHYTPGGFTHVFSRPEYEWDVGVHYVGDVHVPGNILYHVFKYLSNDELKWADLGEVYDRIVIGDKTYDFVKGTSAFKSKLKSYFPDEEKAIDKYFDFVFKASKSSKSFFIEKVLPDGIRFFVSDFMRKNYLKYASQTTLEVLKQCTQNEELIAVLTGQYGDYGLPPSKSSFAIHAAVAKHYFTNGGAYPVGGSVRFFETIAPDILKAGGTVITNAHVLELLTDGNKATGVLMKDGRKITSDIVVSGIGILNTVQNLIPQHLKSKFPKALFTKIPPSVAHVSLYIGLKDTSKNLGLPKANFWIFPNQYNHDETINNFVNDPENNPLPVTYISFPSAKDPDFENRFPGKSTIETITLAPFEWFTKWDNTKWKKRGEDYEIWKEKMSQRLLLKLYEQLPQLKGKIDYYELSTPLSTKHFANYQHGEIYGLEHTPERFAQKAFRPSTPIKNFYLTGQDILTAGIAGAGFAGVLTASAILKQNIVTEIIKMK